MTDAEGDSTCGGAIISAWRVLTAAHCLIDTLSTLVIAGAHDRTANEASQQRATVPARNYLIHESYNDNNLDNDIAMLMLNNPFRINEYVGVIRIAEPTDGVFAGDIGRVSGWGRDESGNTVPRLRYVDRPIISNAECAAQWTGVRSSHICISTTGGNGFCQGDSGGPLTVAAHGKLFVIGVVSYNSAAGCTNGSPHVFTRVSSYASWIQERF